MTETLDRRQFSVAAALALLGGATMTIGCGGGSPNPGSPNPVLAPGDLSGNVSGNHPAPHSVIITAAQLGAGGELTLVLQGGMHNHTLSLTASEVARIAAHERVQEDTSVNPHSNGGDPHNHGVTFN